MQSRERVAPERQPALCLQRGRQRVGPVGGERQRRLDELAELHRRDLLAGRIDGCEVRGRRAAVQVVGADGEAEAVLLAAKAHVRPGRQLVLQPRLVEPGRRDLPAAVGDLRGEDLEPPAPAAKRRLEHVALDQDLLVSEQVRDPLLGRGSLVAARAMVEQVADVLEAELREPLLQGRPDARERVDRRLEALRAEAAARRRPAVRRVHGGETGQRPAHRPSMAAGPAVAAAPTWVCAVPGAASRRPSRSGSAASPRASRPRSTPRTRGGA